VFPTPFPDSPPRPPRQFATSEALRCIPVRPVPPTRDLRTFRPDHEASRRPTDGGTNAGPEAIRTCRGLKGRPPTGHILPSGFGRCRGGNSRQAQSSTRLTQGGEHPIAFVSFWDETQFYCLRQSQGRIDNARVIVDETCTISSTSGMQLLWYSVCLCVISPQRHGAALFGRRVVAAWEEAPWEGPFLADDVAGTL
jgi:hypothetical protein